MILREVTGTVDGFTYLPHLYEINKAGKLVAYTPVGGNRVEFSKPMMFDKRYRKFEKVS